LRTCTKCNVTKGNGYFHRYPVASTAPLGFKRVRMEWCKACVGRYGQPRELKRFKVTREDRQRAALLKRERAAWRQRLMNRYPEETIAPAPKKRRMDPLNMVNR